MTAPRQVDVASRSSATKPVLVSIDGRDALPWWRRLLLPIVAGPRRQISWLLFVTMAMLVLRLPSSVVMCGVLPAVVLLVNGLRRPPRVIVVLGLFLATAVTTSMVAWGRIPRMIAALADDAIDPIPLVNNASLAVVMTCFVAAIVLARHTGECLKALMNGFAFGLWGILLVAVFEVITQIKVLPLLYPDANTAAQVARSRWVVASLYPNFNDFSVAMAVLAAVLVAQLLLSAKVAWWLTAGRIAGVVMASIFIVVIGSRGALGALVIGIGLVTLTAVRLRHKKLISVRSMLLAVVGVFCVAALSSSLPVFNDNSALQRLVIIRESLAMMPSNSGYFWHGFLSMTYFRDLAFQAYGQTLIDPHNLLLEFATMYGVPTLVMYCVVWFVVARRGLWRLEMAPGWREVAAVVISVLLPVVGIVPSSTLRYYWVWPLLGATFAAFSLHRRRPSASESEMGESVAHHSDEDGDGPPEEKRVEPGDHAAPDQDQLAR